MLEELDIIKLSDGVFHVLYAHQSYQVELLNYDLGKRTIEILVNGHFSKVHIKNETDLVIEQLGLDQYTTRKDTALKSPMPGKVLKIMVRPGDLVREGDPLLVLEAMKMENVLKASSEQQIEKVPVKVAEPVDKGQILIRYVQDK